MNNVIMFDDDVESYNLKKICNRVHFDEVISLDVVFKSLDPNSLFDWSEHLGYLSVKDSYVSIRSVHYAFDLLCYEMFDHLHLIIRHGRPKLELLQLIHVSLLSCLCEVSLQFEFFLPHLHVVD